MSGQIIPSWDATASQQQNIELNRFLIPQWICHPVLDQLVAQWNLTAPQSFVDRLDFFYQLANTIWDFRNGAERLETKVVHFDDAQNKAIMSAAGALGLVSSSTPISNRYDTVIVLASALLGCFARVKKAKELIDKGVITKCVIGLGGDRTLLELEKDQAASLGYKISTEHEAMTNAFAEAFDCDIAALDITEHEDTRPNMSWCITSFRTNQRLSVVSAPSSEPEKRRANTADTLVWWINHYRPHDEINCLFITDQIYLPYQAAEAVRVIGLDGDISIGFAGVSTPNKVGGLVREFSPQQYLQEIGSAIRAYRQLWLALDEAAANVTALPKHAIESEASKPQVWSSS